MMARLFTRARLGVAAAVLALALPVLTPSPAAAWWYRGGPGWGGPGWGWHRPGLVVAVPPVFVGPPVVYAPPRPFWIRAHWNGPYFVPGHWR